MSEKARVQAELESMQIVVLSMLWKAAHRWGEAAAGRGLGKDQPPHHRAKYRRLAQNCLKRYFDALEKVVTLDKDFSWPTTLTTKKSGALLPSTAPKKK